MNKKTIGTLFCVPFLFLIFFYLAGVIYFLLNHASTNTVTPYTFIEQWRFYHSDLQYQKSLNIAAMVSFSISFLIPALIVIGILNPKKSLFGDAKFAVWRDIEKMELNKQDKGILIGKWRNTYLFYRGDAFVLLFAPTRGGKGVGFVIPNLLNWRQSCVVTDFKLENFDITSKFRAFMGQEVFLFAPFNEDGQTHRYNPLGYVREGHLVVPDILTIAEMLYPTDTNNETTNYFAQLAQNLFLGLALYVKSTPDLPFTIGEIVRQSSGKGKTLNEHLTGIITSRSDLSEHCVTALNAFLAEDEQRGQKNVLSSFKAPLKDWSNPIFDAATAANDFDLRDIRKKKMSIYVGITPDYIPVAGRILNLFFSQLINLNTKELPEQNPELKYKCLLLMDEFTAMGRSAIIAKSNNYFAGYGLQLATIAQNEAQVSADIPEGYGRSTAKTLISNHEVQIIFTPEKEDAENISRFLGDTTVKQKNEQRTSGKHGRTVTTSDAKRALMLPQELRELPDNEEIIMMRGKKPIRCKKIRYYNDPSFINRLKQVSTSLKKLGDELPTHTQMKNAIAKGELRVSDIPYTNISRVVIESPVAESPVVPALVTADLLESESYSDDDIPSF